MSVVPGDEGVPHIARIDDYLLGGSHNLAVDRARAEELIAARPTILATARADRLLLRHAVEQALDLGIRQFLDLGAGIPTAGAVLSLATLHFLPEADGPARVPARHREAFGPGSVLAITHSSDDFPDHPVFAAASREVARPAESTSHPLTLRSRAEIEAMVRAAGFVPDADGLREVRCWASLPQDEPLGGDAVISEPVA